jgi:hypothetical protein
VVPYLSADRECVAKWRSEFDSADGFKIGIVWQGNTSTLGGRQRAIPLRSFEPLARVPGVRLYSFQKGPGSEQLRDHASALGIRDLAGKLDEGTGGFVDTAAVMMHLDLVVGADTSIPHLAGALGVPVWVALRRVPDWRWLLGRDDTPWYPTMRLFRLNEGEDWTALLARMGRVVEGMAQGAGRG